MRHCGANVDIVLTKPQHQNIMNHHKMIRGLAIEAGHFSGLRCGLSPARDTSLTAFRLCYVTSVFENRTPLEQALPNIAKRKLAKTNSENKS